VKQKKHTKIKFRELFQYQLILAIFEQMILNTSLVKKCSIHQRQVEVNSPGNAFDLDCGLINDDLTKEKTN
jgi:hypothetical protein